MLMAFTSIIIITLGMTFSKSGWNMAAQVKMALTSHLVNVFLQWQRPDIWLLQSYKTVNTC